MASPAASTGQNILFVQTAFLGDVLLSIPVLKRLRSRGTVTLLCRRGVGSFFRDADLVDHVIEVDKSSSASWAAARASVSDVMGSGFDLLICPHESFRTAHFIASIPANVKIGFKRWFNLFTFTHRVRRPLEWPEALRQLALLAPIDSSVARDLAAFAAAFAAESARDAKAGGVAADGSLLPVPAGFDMGVESVHSVSAAIEPFADSQEPVVVMAPGSVWKTKMWTKEGFIETGRALAAQGAIVAITGSKDEVAICQEIASQIPNSTSLAGRLSLFESAQLMAHAKLLVCNDSGAMHLGATAGVPIVSVFGPTVLRFGYRPWSSNARVVQTDLVCRPCGKHGSNECPLGHHNCMKMVKAADVLNAARDVVDSSALSKL